MQHTLPRTISVLVIAISALSIAACNPKQDSTAATPAAPVAETPATVPPSPPVETQTAAPASKRFKLEDVAVSDANLGRFPYFSAPEGTEYINGGGKQVKFDLSQIAIDGKLVPVEGPWFGAYVQSTRGSEWAQRFVDKSYEDIITSLGGVKIFQGSVLKPEATRLNEAKQLDKAEGNFDYWNDDPIQTYVIRKANGAAVYVQVQTNSAGGRIQVAQQGEFKQTITLLKADDLKKSLDSGGKAVVHVQFDVDQAFVQPDGMQAVAEIASLLKADPKLRLSIEGHTDNSGSKEHNLPLSKNRAATVQQLLQLAGIETARLKTNGFGGEKPLVPNDSEGNKAQNRRVELVKF